MEFEAMMRMLDNAVSFHIILLYFVFYSGKIYCPLKSYGVDIELPAKH